MTRRFTVDGSAQLESFLAGICSLVARDVPVLLPAQRLEAVLLGGGYGRGEGGVWRDAARERPYNDLDFYVLMRRPRRCHQRALRDLAALLGQMAAVEVELQLASPAQLRQPIPSMFYYDLVAGHHWLWGAPELLQQWQHHQDPSQLPLAEAWRLLINRCTGLLLARHLWTQTEFVDRNLAKAELALGDVVLTVAHQYHASCRERHQRLQNLVLDPAPAWLTTLRTLHERGVTFKLHPHPLPERDQRFAEVSGLARQVWAWLAQQPTPAAQRQQRRGRQLVSRLGRARLRRWLPALLWGELDPSQYRRRLRAYQALWPHCR